MNNTATPQAKQFTEPGVTIVQGDALALDLPDDSVDLVVTSPPYFGLRSYQDGGEHYDGQIGAEATPAEFVDALIAATREMVRVTKPSGSLWVNLGDKYAGAGGGGAGSSDGATGRGTRPSRKATGIPTKSLSGIPWRYAIRCIDDLGLILRAEVIWSKPNGLPESVKDRVRRSHETWFHFTLNPRYYSAVDEIREAHQHPHIAHTGPRSSRGEVDGNAQHLRMGLSPLGKLPGSVWTIPTEPLRVPEHLGIDHFAAFPTEWPRRIITGWSPRGVCVECGEGRRPIRGRTDDTTGAPDADAAKVFRRQDEITLDDLRRLGKNGLRRTYDLRNAGHARNFGGEHRDRLGERVLETFGGWAERVVGMATQLYTLDGTEACACPEPTAPTTPGVVLDPFGGTGTTALVAEALGRHGISNDMSADYCRLARWRTSDPKQRDKAAS